MKKLLFFLSFMLVASCGYQPIFSSKNSNFLIKQISYNENDKISQKIKKGLDYLTITEEYSKVFNLDLNSEKKIFTASKDAKGNALVYKMTVITNIKIYSNNEIINKKKIEKSFNYKNTTNKFNLKQYEKTIENNLIENIKEDIILILYN